MRASKRLALMGIVFACAGLLLGSAVAIAQALSRVVVSARAMPLDSLTETELSPRDLHRDVRLIAPAGAAR